MKILLGTYTREKSQGIYEITLDPQKKKLRDLKLLAKTENPTYLDYNPKEKKIYSVYQKDNLGGLAIWDYDGQNLILNTSFTEEGKAPCYVYYDEKENRVFDANYHTGKVNAYQESQKVLTWDYGPNAHAHYVHKNEKNQDIYTCDLGNDEIHRYRNLKKINSLKMDNNSGPRHIAFHPQLNLLYVFAELNNTVTVVKEKQDSLERVQVISTLPKAHIESSGAAIRISKDGRHLYVSNRGHDSITMFEIDSQGELSYRQNISSYGQHPRDFNLSPDNKFLVLANRDSDNLTLYERSEKTGRLKLLEKDVQAPEVVNIYFLGED